VQAAVKLRYDGGCYLASIRKFALDLQRVAASNIEMQQALFNSIRRKNLQNEELYTL
jgi:hypothetical protein